MIKFEDLKIGDIITKYNYQIPYTVRAIGPNCVVISSTVYEIDNYLKYDWAYYTPPKKKKVKLMSPALYKWQDGGGFFISKKLFETELDATNFLNGYVHSWPAKDANGNPIQYAVEVEE